MNLKYIIMRTTYNVQHHHERSKSSQEPQLSQLGYRSDQNEHQSNIYLLGVSAGFWGSKLRKARSNFNQLAEPTRNGSQWLEDDLEYLDLDSSSLGRREALILVKTGWGVWGFHILIEFAVKDQIESDVAVRFKRKRNKLRVVWELSEVEGLLIETRIFGFRDLWCSLISKFCSLPLKLTFSVHNFAFWPPTFFIFLRQGNYIQHYKEVSLLLGSIFYQQPEQKGDYCG